MFVTDGHIRPNLTFLGKAGAYQSGAFTANIRLTMTNTLAYCGIEFIEVAKSLKGQTSRISLVVRLGLSGAKFHQKDHKCKGATTLSTTTLSITTLSI